MVTSSFLFFLEVWLLQSVCDCKYGLSLEEQNEGVVKHRKCYVLLRLPDGLSARSFASAPLCPAAGRRRTAGAAETSRT